MVNALQARNAITMTPSPRGVQLSEVQNLGKIDLRGDPNDRAFMSAVGRALDLLLPTEPCQSTTKDEIVALWLGPDEWLITCPKNETADTASKLIEATADVHAAIIDLSDARAVFRLSGPSALEVLAKGCPLDLHPRTVSPGYVAGSVLAKISALIHLRDAETVDIYIGRSYADYLLAWLQEAGADCGLIIS